MCASFVDRIRIGWSISRDSLTFLARERDLLVLPVLSGIIYLVSALVVFAVVFLGIVGVGETPDEGTSELIYIAGVLVYLLLTSISLTFFAAALVYCADRRFRGHEASIREGLAVAWKRKSKIVAWGILTAGVGFLIRRLSRRGGGGTAASGLLGFSRSVVSFYAVPTIVFSEGSIRETLSESARLFKGTWGEYASLSLGINLLLLPPIAIVILASVFGMPMLADSLVLPAIVLAALLVGVVLLVRQTALGVAKAALYTYATTDRLPPQFADVDLDALASRRAEPPGRGGI